MIQHPAILALTITSLITGGMLAYSAWFGTHILEKWDLKSSSEEQLELERRTYLISIILNYSLIFQILSLFLYIFTADNLHNQFTGAMCAAGSLAINSYGYPVLILKIINCLFAGVWLLINNVDTSSYDYPLIKPKYRLLAILSPMILLEGLFQFVYFFNLKADIITSCCGSLFSSDKRSIAGEIANLPIELMQWVFFASMALTGLCGAYFIVTKKGGMLFSIISTITLIIASASLVTFISLYFYELPTHHCPFCILQKEYNYIGYFLYALLMIAGVSGISVGAIAPFTANKSLIKIIPTTQKNLALLCIISFFIFTLICIWKMLSSSFQNS